MQGSHEPGLRPAGILYRNFGPMSGELSFGGWYPVRKWFWLLLWRYVLSVIRNWSKFIGFPDREHWQGACLLFLLPLIFVPFNFAPLIFAPLLFASFQTVKHFNSKFLRSSPLNFAPPQFQRLIRSLKFFSTLEAKVKGGEIWRE